VNFLEVSHVSKKSDDRIILKDISFRQKQFQRLVIAGETGSGKSSLLKIISGHMQADAGEVHLKGDKIKGPDESLVAGHTQIAYLSQQFDLPKFLRVEQVLEYASSIPAKEASSVFSVCRIDHLLQRKTDQLSGGEKQRIAIARLLIGKPSLLLLDEPFTNLDMVLKGILKKVIDDIGKKLRITCIMVSHDPADTLSWADEIIVLKDGNIIQHGTPRQIYGEPVNEYVAGLFGDYNLLTIGQQKIVRVKHPGVNRLVRPEEFRIRQSKTANRFHIEEVRFCGNIYELRLTYRQLNLLVTTTQDKYKAGDRVEISLSESRKN